jgi:hypothetical protein
MLDMQKSRKVPEGDGSGRLDFRFHPIERFSGWQASCWFKRDSHNPPGILKI